MSQLNRGVRPATARQRRGASEFGGSKQLQNTLPPKTRVDDLSPSERARLIKRTGQEAKVDSPGDLKYFLGMKP